MIDRGSNNKDNGVFFTLTVPVDNDTVLPFQEPIVRLSAGLARGPQVELWHLEVRVVEDALSALHVIEVDPDGVVFVVVALWRESAGL